MFYFASAAVLIVGSYNTGHDDTAELYHPSSGASCTLPQLPDSIWDVTVNEKGFLCGGYNTKDSCIQVVSSPSVLVYQIPQMLCNVKSYEVI